ncbi:MAG TPA: 2-oxo acid dehydrogenase subunit E2 [Polyangiales bacterium]
MRQPEPNGRYQVVTPSLDRRLAMDAFAAIPCGHPMVAALEFDVSAPLAVIETLKAQGNRVSLFAFLVRCIARAIAEHPDLNLVRHGKRLVRFEDVDVCVPLEVETRHGPAPREIVVRRAQTLTAQTIYQQLELARTEHARTGALGSEDRWARSMMRAFGWLPRSARIAVIRLIIRSAFRVKARAGTTMVTSVSKFASVPGAAFTFSTGPRAALFVVGSVVEKPWLHEGHIVPRHVLSLSMIVDHDLVDGAPAARFATCLRSLIESADGLGPVSRTDSASRTSSVVA